MESNLSYDSSMRALKCLLIGMLLFNYGWGSDISLGDPYCEAGGRGQFIVAEVTGKNNQVKEELVGIFSPHLVANKRSDWKSGAGLEFKIQTGPSHSRTLVIPYRQISSEKDFDLILKDSESLISVGWRFGNAFKQTGSPSLEAQVFFKNFELAEVKSIRFRNKYDSKELARVSREYFGVIPDVDKDRYHLYSFPLIWGSGEGDDPSVVIKIPPKWTRRGAELFSKTIEQSLEGLHIAGAFTQEVLKEAKYLPNIKESQELVDLFRKLMKLEVDCPQGSFCNLRKVSQESQNKFKEEMSGTIVRLRSFYESSFEPHRVLYYCRSTYAFSPQLIEHLKRNEAKDRAQKK